MTNDYGVVTLSWELPDTYGEAGSVYTRLRLVRSSKGYPITFDDGEALLDTDSATTSYTDGSLTPGRFAYYSMFVGLNPSAWVADVEYIANELVLGYDGHPYRAIVNSVGYNPPDEPTKWELLEDGAIIWVKAEGIAVLPPENHNYQEVLYFYIPAPYRALSDAVMEAGDIDNPYLRKFTGIFGFALDQIRTDYDQIPKVRDIDLMQASLLDRVAADLGDGIYPSVPYRLRRSRLKNFSAISRMKGTIEGARSSVNSVTGWDIVLEPGYNLMLDTDVAEFTYPVVEAWSASISYPVGYVVRSGEFYYRCKQAAKGAGQAPSGAATTNTWWTYLTAANTELPYVGEYSAKTVYGEGSVVWYNNRFYKAIGTGMLGDAPTGAATSNSYWTYLSDDVGVTTPGNVETGGIHGWEAGPELLIFDGALYNYIDNSYLSLKHNQTGPDSVTNGSNLLTVTNRSGSTSRIAARSIPRVLTVDSGTTSPDLTQGDVARWGVPIQRSKNWSSTVTYEIGDTVQWGPSRYVCLAEHSGVAPTGTTNGNKYWAYLGRVEDVAYTASYYTKTAGTGRKARAQIEWYSGDGDLIAVAGEALNPADVGKQYADTFTGFEDLSSRAVPIYAGTATPVNWAVVSGSAWKVGYNVAYLDPTVGGQPAMCFAYIVAEHTGSVAVTFRDVPDSLTQGAGVIFRGSDDTNFWYATRSQLVKVVAGTPTVVDSWTPLEAGDRLRVDFENSGDGISVKKYNPVSDWPTQGRYTVLATSTDTFNQTGTRVGLYGDFA